MSGPDNNNPLQLCPKCREPLPWATINAGPSTCTACHTALEITAFPALFRGGIKGQTGQVLITEGDAGCFYHPGKKAVVACSACGRFLCSLCDIELAQGHICAGCIEVGRRKGTLARISTHRVLYDEIVLALGLLSLFLLPLALVTTPAVGYLAIRHWRTPLSVVHPSRWKMVTGLVCALLAIPVAVATVILVVKS